MGKRKRQGERQGERCDISVLGPDSATSRSYAPLRLSYGHLFEVVANGWVQEPIVVCLRGVLHNAV